MTLSVRSWALLVLVWALIVAALFAVVTILDLPAWAAIGLGVFPVLITRSLARDLRAAEAKRADP